VKTSPRKIVIDSGLIVALIDHDDPFHELSVDFVRGTSAQLLTTMACVTEVMFILRDVRAQTSALKWIENGGLDLEELELSDIGRVGELLKKYADRPMDFADAVLVALCERLDIPHIATFDSDFEVYRFKGRRHFINVLK
jgi:uncharacterized protein